MVLRPNPRGSNNSTLQFREAIAPDWSGITYADNMAGVDYLIEKGLVDPERMGECVGGALEDMRHQPLFPGPTASRLPRSEQLLSILFRYKHDGYDRLDAYVFWERSLAR